MDALQKTIQSYELVNVKTLCQNVSLGAENKRVMNDTPYNWDKRFAINKFS